MRVLLPLVLRGIDLIQNVSHEVKVALLSLSVGVKQT